MNNEVCDSRFRYCPRCGLDSGTSDQFCRACGTSLTRTTKAPVPRDHSHSSPARGERFYSSRRGFRIGVGLACLVVVAGAVVAITAFHVRGQPYFTFSATDAENLIWRVSHVPTLPGHKGSSASLVSVSCPTSSFCIGVGTRQYYNSQASSYSELPLVARFSGSRWTMEPIVSPDSATPVGQLPEDQLTNVSCPTDRFCIAVGSFGRLSTSTGLGVGVSGALVEIFNGTTWHTVELRASTNSNASAYLEAVSCLHPRSCFVVGTASNPQGVQTLISYKYNNGSWASVPFAAVGKDSADNLNSLYCSAINRCLAVGTSSVGTFASSKAMAAVYAGDSWELVNPLTSTQQAAGVSSFADASCLSDGRCVAIGSIEVGEYWGANTEFGPIVDSFRSGKWQVLVAPNSSEFANVAFDAVDCHQTWCSIVGVQGTSLFIETFANSAWYLSASVPSIPAKTGFNSVSCSPEGRCVAVGYTPSGPIALVGSLPSRPGPG